MQYFRRYTCRSLNFNDKIAVAKPGTSNFDGYGITCILNNYYQQIKTIICLMASKSMDWFPFEMIVALKRAVWLSCISHSWCSKWPPSARTHARRRWRHWLTASSIMSWSKWPQLLNEDPVILAEHHLETIQCNECETVSVSQRKAYC